ncbi:hypothetical protein BT93_K0775 [Corymbia citriodora subsp. variegata]|nr:hypothetical protein BT93_K0775 [Corymbia citriodora subsp. variegata]
MEGRMQRKVVDASSFFLFEDSGDSEVDGRDPGHEEVPMEEDDAESCSYDSSDWANAGDDVVVGECDVDVATWLRDGHEEDEYESGDEQDSHVQLPGVEYKSCVSVESTNELMNEREKSKLFWEACLAS